MILHDEITEHAWMKVQPKVAENSAFDRKQIWAQSAIWDHHNIFCSVLSPKNDDVFLSKIRRVSANRHVLLMYDLFWTEKDTSFSLAQDKSKPSNLK